MTPYPPPRSNMLNLAGSSRRVIMESKVSQLLRLSVQRKRGDLRGNLVALSQNRYFAFSPRRPARREREEDRSEDQFLRSLNFGNRNGGDGGRRSNDLLSRDRINDTSARIGKSPPSSTENTIIKDESKSASPRDSNNLFTGALRNSSIQRELREDRPENFLLQKLKLGLKADAEKSASDPSVQRSDSDPPLSESSAQDADAIFRKMKETGLIPNAVAMLDGLCKDGLIQEAMKLFGVMREKGSIPEVVIYTAVVEGFCKISKFDDAIRVFRKMLNNGISPNAFSYKVLIEGLVKGSRLEDAVDLCLEMMEAGHSLTVVTFADLVDQLCKVKGVEESAGVVRRLRERGLAIDDKAMREHLDKMGPSSPQTWEAIFGKKKEHKFL